MRLFASIVTAALLASPPALAINFDQIIPSIDGKTPPPVGRDGTQQEPLTLRLVCVNALLADEPNLAATEKLKRYFLAKKVQDAGPNAKLSIEEIVLIKERVGKLFPPLIMGQAWMMLDPDTASPSAEK